MKKIFSITMLAILFATVPVSCIAGRSNNSVKPASKIAKQTVTGGAFDELEVSSSIDVNYIVSNEYSVEISAPENLIEYVNVSQSNNELSLSMKSVSVNGDPNINVTVKCPSLKAVSLHGASTFQATGIKCQDGDFELELDGAAKAGISKIIASSVEMDLCGASETTVSVIEASSIELDMSGASKLTASGIDASRIEADASGASKVKLSGKAVNVEYDASGASSFDAASLRATNGSVEASGASSVKVNIKNVYELETSGSAVISNN